MQESLNINNTNSNINSLSIYSDLESELKSSESKFDFTTTTKKKNNIQFYIPYIIVIIIVCITLGGFLGLANFIPIPEILPVIENKITNDEIVFTSNKTPFYVKYNDTIVYSTKNDGIWNINLGKIDGKLTYKLGGFYDLGWQKVLGKNTKSVTLERDFTAPNIKLISPNYIDSNILNFELDFEKEENIKVLYQDNLIYSKESTNNICDYDKSNKLRLNCKLNLGTNKETELSLTVIDDFNNSITAKTKSIKVVEPLTLYCNEDKIINEGHIQCNFNRIINGKFILDDKIIELTKTNIIDFKITNTVNKTYKINISGTDEYQFKQEFIKEIAIDTIPFEASMWVDNIIDNVQLKSVYNVYAMANKDAVIESSYTDNMLSYEDYPNGLTKSFVGSGNSNVFQKTELFKGQTILIKSDSIPFTGCINKCIERVYSINIYPLNNPTNKIKYTCLSGIWPNLIKSCTKN